jgi:hypothetical protein
MFVLAWILWMLPPRNVAEYFSDTTRIVHNPSVLIDNWMLQRWTGSSGLALAIAIPSFIQNLSKIIIFQSQFRKIYLHVLFTMRRMETRKISFDFYIKYPLFRRSLHFTSWISWIAARNIWIVYWKKYPPLATQFLFSCWLKRMNISIEHHADYCGYIFGS